MLNPKVTRIKVREDKAASICGSLRGANIDAVAFNISFIALRKPALALRVMQVFKEASEVHEDDPQSPDEDLELYAEKFFALLHTADEQ